MNFTDEEIESLLIDLIDGQLSPEARAEVEQHLAGHPAHQQAYAQLQTLLGAFGQPSEQLPSPQWRAEFDQWLAAEQLRQAGQEPSQLAPLPGQSTRPGRGKIVAMFRHRALQVAASVTVLVGVFFFGRFTTRARLRAAEQEVGRLRTEARELRQLAMLQMLKQPSASERIMAVGYANGLAQADGAVTRALLDVLNHDPNLNVRLAAAEALARFGREPGIRQAVVASLGRQTEPMVQLTLIGLLVEWKEKEALGPMQRLMQDQAAPEIVRAKAAEGVGVLYQL
jgi:anti-sigma factor RsiW